MKPKTVVVHDRMQQGYTCRLTEPPGRDFDPVFKPDLTPAQMLKLGVFGRKYLADCAAEFPAAWFRGAKLSPEGRRAELNCFAVLASKPLAYRRAKGRIHRSDPRGWSQRCCRYYQGRRCPDDARQIGPLEGHDPPHRAAPPPRPARRRRLPPAPAPGAFRVCLRAPKAMT